MTEPIKDGENEVDVTPQSFEGVPDYMMESPILQVVKLQSELAKAREEINRIYDSGSQKIIQLNSMCREKHAEIKRFREALERISTQGHDLHRLLCKNYPKHKHAPNCPIELTIEADEALGKKEGGE